LSSKVFRIANQTPYTATEGAWNWPPSARPQGQKNDRDPPPYSPATEDDEPVEPALKRPKSSSTAIESGPFSPMTESDQDSPVSEIKTKTQAEDLLMAKATQKLQETTQLLH
jgi:hypothetical protein